MGRHSNTQVWEYFDYVSDRFAECQACKALITTPQKATYNLKRHLYTIHAINTFIKGTNLHKKSDKNGSTSRRWKLKKKFIKTSDCEAGKIRKYYRNSTCESNDNISISSQERDEVNSIASHSTQKKDLYEDKIFGIDTVDSCHELKNFQDDPLSKPIITITPAPKKTQDRYTSPIPTTIPIPKVEKRSSNNSTSYYELERIKAEALVEKYKAEAGYFSQLAELTRSKRLFLDLQCEQMRKELDQQD